MKPKTIPERLPRPNQVILVRAKLLSSGHLDDMEHIVSGCFMKRTYGIEFIDQGFVPFLDGYILMETLGRKIEILDWIGFDYQSDKETKELERIKEKERIQELARSARSKLTQEELDALKKDVDYWITSRED